MAGCLPGSRSQLFLTAQRLSCSPLLRYQPRAFGALARPPGNVPSLASSVFKPPAVCAVGNSLGMSTNNTARSSGLETVGRSNGGDRRKKSTSSDAITARPYQLELLEAALCENTIVNLGTGAGKTFIAVMLIKELSGQILERQFSDTAKRTIFIVNTVPLVRQQAEYIRAHTLLDVGHYYGDMNVDAWPKEKWVEELSKNHVLVMTHTIFKNLLHSGFMHLKNVNLLVFDECHHAVKDHEYVQIMRVFDSCRQDEYPHILGLSASLLPSKCKPGRLEKKVKDLEITLKCKSQTAGDIAEVTRYATNPEEVTVGYSSVPTSPHSAELRQILSEPLAFLNCLPKAQRNERYVQIAKTHLDDCQHILDNLGIWCALQCAEEGISDLSSKEDPEPSEKGFLGLSQTHLKLFAQKTRKIQGDDEIDVTSKVQELLSCLTDLNALDPQQASARPSTKSMGIVFVERRTTAVCLTKLLRNLSRKQDGLRHIRCNFIVGHGETKGYTNLRKDTQMKTKKQHEILEKFRKQKINLLVSTSVVEEGLDVPRCNLVIRFDFPPNFRAYMQSKGRARAKPSKYILLIEQEQCGQIMGNLSDYQILEKELQTLCLGRTPPDDELFLAFLQEEEQNIYAPYGREAGVRATLNTSVSLLYKYCQKFSDKFTSSAPVFTCESRDAGAEASLLWGANADFEYRSTVQLPISCPLREEITGHWMPTRRIADKSAALMAIKTLHEHNELDEHLRIISLDQEDSEEEPDNTEEAEQEDHAGTERRTQYYPNQVSTFFSDCCPKPGAGNHLYVLMLEEAKPHPPTVQFSKQPPEGPHYGVGILTQKPLPYQRIPQFSLYEGKTEINVRVVSLPTQVAPLTAEEIQLLKESHQVMFEDVLKMHPSWLRCSFEGSQKDFLVVPIGILPLTAPLQAFIDFETALKVVESKNAHVTPVNLESLEDAVVTKTYPSENLGYFEVKSVDPQITPSSPFPNSSFASYANFYQQRYNVTFTDPQQPALMCKKISFTDTQLRMIVSRYKDTHGNELDRKASRSQCEVLFPDVTCTSLFSLSANFLKVLRCLPSILWRIESVLLIDDLLTEVAEHTGIGRFTNDVVTVDATSSTKLQGYKDCSLDMFETQWEFNYKTDTVSDKCFIPTEELIVRGPNSALALQALTPASANDTVDSERLETLGDSFLKLATATFLFCDRPDAYEDRLTSARMRRISNRNLYLLAKKRKIIGKLLSKQFEPTKMWIPPGFTFVKSPSSDDTSPTIGGSDHLGGVAVQDVADHLGGVAVQDVADHLGGVAVQDVADHLGGVAVQDVADHLGGVAVQDVADHLGGVAVQDVADKERAYLYHKVTDKGAADCIESLIGAYLMAGGFEAALRFMKWLGLKIVRKKTASDVQEEEMLSEGEFSSSSSSSLGLPPCKQLRPSPEFNPFEPSTNLLIHHSSDIFMNHFGPLPCSIVVPSKSADVKKLLQISIGALQPQQIQKTINWTFKDPAILLQALTHSSYQRNRVTNCYQRLEFLGDAILDYLVTIHVYKQFPHFGPGKITDMRSALVSNNTFAELAVKINLHKAFLHSSPALFKLIPEYVNKLAQRSERDEDDDIPMTDYEDEDEDDSESDEDVDDMEPPKVLGDLLESLAGAIFIDSGMDLQAVWSVLEPLFTAKIDQFKGEIPVPPIRKLHETFPGTKVKFSRAGQQRTCCTLTILRDGKDTFVVKEEGYSRRAAKNAAALSALRRVTKTNRNPL